MNRTALRQLKILDKIDQLEKKRRTFCEICGAKLTNPEMDYRNIAICKKCLKGQLK